MVFEMVGGRLCKKKWPSNGQGMAIVLKIVTVKTVMILLAVVIVLTVVTVITVSVAR